MTGLTSVHVNRMLQQLRRERLIGLHARKLVVSEGEGLAQVALFKPDYLDARPGQA